MASYKQILEDCRIKLLDIINDEEGWEKCQNEKQIVITRKLSTFFDGHVFKGEVDIDAPFDKVAKIWAPNPKGHREEWDTHVTSLECVEEIDEEVYIVRTVTPSAAMGLVAARELIDLMMLRFEDDGQTAMTVSKSIEHNDCPIQDKLVRGTNYPGGTLYRKTGPYTTHMTYIGHTCLGGNLPTSVVEALMPRTIHSMLDTLRKASTQ
ncbi:stAR-related lipid transfer protein 5-like [Amphiura filiformis]|uniref:stAR-related lipid transfer protein 5-like n=1 Tax=Amphiura filiformis TaxID=82378 RepID=UPI003B21F12F